MSDTTAHDKAGHEIRRGDRVTKDGAVYEVCQVTEEGWLNLRNVDTGYPVGTFASSVTLCE